MSHLNPQNTQPSETPATLITSETSVTSENSDTLDHPTQKVQQTHPLQHKLATVGQSNSYARVLSIAGSDSGGGAGIQADIKTISALGCYATTAITALTAQNTLGVQSVNPVPSSFLGEQIKSVLDDIGTDSVKVGMFASVQNLELITALLKQYAVKQMVFDPVMISSSGTLLVDAIASDLNSRPQALRSLKEGVLSLMRLSALFTPNLSEVSFLLDKEVQSIEDMKEAASSLIALGANAVLIKGGHLLGADKEVSAQVVDVFMDGGLTPVLMQSKRIVSSNLHGTGCTLSSAIASYLASGSNLIDAVRLGRGFLLKAIETGALASFNGAGPLNHGFAPAPLKIRASEGN